MPDVRSLAGEDAGRLYGAFMAAFADYSVPLRMSFSDFAENNARRGFDPSISLGAYEGDRLVGFVLNGLGRWSGRPAAYDLGTGVLPEARGSALAGTLASRSVALLPSRGLELYVLEVIRGNLPAFKTYEKAGFSITRSLECPEGSYADDGRPSPEGLEVVELPGGAAFPRSRVARFRDWEPSWQNSDDSIARMPGRLSILMARLTGGPEDVAEGGEGGRLAGFVVASPKGTIWQLAVARDLRRMGIGSALLRELARRVGPALRYVNVDARDEICLSFLARRGLGPGVGQYEMARELGTPSGAGSARLGEGAPREEPDAGKASVRGVAPR